jgi:secreted trypsin-like serine protease
MWPWLIAVFHKTPSMNKFICGASLLTEKISITAAHCIQENAQAYKKRAKDIQLHIGRYDIENDNESDYEISGVKIIIVNPYWLETSDYSHDADVALLVLEQPTIYGVYIQPVCLWHGSDDIIDIVNSTGTVVGWGKQNEKETSNVPWMTEIYVIADNTCLRSDQDFFHLTSERTFCGRSDKESGPCTGDSGGGFYMKIGEQWILRGIVAGSLVKNYKCDLENPAVYTDVAKFLRWINTNIIFYSAR